MSRLKDEFYYEGFAHGSKKDTWAQDCPYNGPFDGGPGSARAKWLDGFYDARNKSGNKLINNSKNNGN